MKKPIMRIGLHRVILSLSLLAFLFSSCTVDTDDLSVINIPQCVAVIQVTLSQSGTITKTSLGEAVTGGTASFKELGAKLTGMGFDLDKEVDVTVELKGLSGECQNLKKVISGTVKFVKGGDSVLDYNSLK